MDRECIDLDSRQSTSLTSVEYNPDTFVKRGIFPDGETLVCILCSSTMKRMKDIPLHIVGIGHCTRFESANANCAKVDKHFACKLCRDYQAADWKEFLYHFKEKEHHEELKSIRMMGPKKIFPSSLFSYRSILTNQIIEYDPDTFFCCCCKELIYGKNLVLQHIKEEKHGRIQKDRNQANYIAKFQETLCRTLVKNFINHESLNKFFCNLCNSWITGSESCREHAKSDSEHIHNFITSVNVDPGSVLENNKSIRDHQDQLAEASQAVQKIPMTKRCDDELKPADQSKEASSIQPTISLESKPEDLRENIKRIYVVNPEKLRTINLSCQLCIPETSDIIYCLICKKSVASKLQTFYEHICSFAHMMYLAEAEKNDKHFMSSEHPFSDLKLCKEFMQNGEGNIIQCFTCNESLQYDEVVILRHILERSHETRKQLWNKTMEYTLQNILVGMESTPYNIQKYWCQHCDVEYNTESYFAEHIDSKEHVDRLNEMGEFQNRLVYDSCIACATLWLGFPGIYTQHCNQPMHKNQVQSRGSFQIGSNVNASRSCKLYGNKLIEFKSSQASTLARQKNTQSQVCQEKKSQLDIVKTCKELELIRKTLMAKVEPDIGRFSSIPKNVTSLENPLHRLTIADLTDEKELRHNQSKNSTEHTPRHMISRKRDVRVKNGRAFDPNFLKVNMQHIYEVNAEKLRTVKLSCQLCFPITSNLIYCLICEKSVANKLQTFYEHICSSAHSTYLAEVEKNDKYFIDYPDQFSDLTLAKEFMQEGTEDTIQCFACDASMQNDDVVIRQHVTEYFHLKNKLLWNDDMQRIMQEMLAEMEATWYNVQKYWCQPCNIEYNTEFHFAEHMESEEHKERLKQIGSFQNRLAYDSCIMCAMLWLGFSGIYAQHCKQPMHKYLVHSGDFSVCKLTDQTITLLQNAEAEVTNLIELSDQVSTIQKTKSDSLLKCLEDTVKPIYPDAKAYPFGSRVSGLGFPNSDIDVFLDCGTYDGNNTTENYQERLIISVAQCLNANQQSWEIEETLVATRTPIIKLRHRDTELSCDVSFKNGLSVENSKLLKCYIDNYPLCRKLMLFVKKWLSLCNLSGSQYITNYATSWYVIFFLQSKSIVPSVASLIAKENRSKIIYGWETGISETFDVDGQEYTFTELLHGFFYFYTNFDFRCLVACPIIGRTVLKEDFTDLDLLPKEMAPYVNHVLLKNVEGLAELFRIDSEMCIQDPYDLSHNLTKAVRKFTLNRFKRLCAESAAYLYPSIQDRLQIASPSQRCDIL